MALRNFKAGSNARRIRENEQNTRERSLMVLVINQLYNDGLKESAITLEREAGINVSKFVVADNIDLNFVMTDFESYYEIKHNKPPTVVKRVANQPTRGIKHERKRINLRKARIDAKSTEVFRVADGKRRKSTSERTNVTISQPNLEVNSKSLSFENSKELSEKRNRYTITTSANDIVENCDQDIIAQGSGKEAARARRSRRMNYNPPDGLPDGIGPPLALKGVIGGHSGWQRSNKSKRILSSGNVAENKGNERSLGESLPYHLDENLSDIATMINRDIFVACPNVRWDDVIELDDAKRLLKEAVVMPTQIPEMFTGLLSPWKGVLLYGPPGTGKTMLAKAVATECGTTFFNVSAATLVSKWRGNSEKLVRMLFELARHHAPSTIFIDEIDSIMAQRRGGREHEASRRMKTELLVQLDGLARCEDCTKKPVFLLAASNLPWELDTALLRRLEKRVLVRLPEINAREAMLRRFLPRTIEGEHSLHSGRTLANLSDEDYKNAAKHTVNFTGADIRLLCKEAAMRPLRLLLKRLEESDERSCSTNEDSTSAYKSTRIAMEAMKTSKDDYTELRPMPVTEADLSAALKKVKPSSRNMENRYNNWAKKFGSI